MSAVLGSLPFEPTSFDTEVVLPWSTRWSQRVTNEDDAIAAALDQVGPNQTQVTITVHSVDLAKTFAVRHFTWDDQTRTVRDSGYRCWVDGCFVGGVPPHATKETA